MTNTLTKNSKNSQSLGSSETIRKTPNFYTFSDLVQDQKIFNQPFDWSCIQEFLPLHKKKYSPEFLEWFVGFSEGSLFVYELCS